MILPRVKPKKGPDPHRSMIQMTHEIFLKYLEIDEDDGRHRALLQHQLQQMEKELDAKDRS